MKTLNVLVILLFLTIPTIAQNWTWINGSNERNQAGEYGELKPGARKGAVSWKDVSDNYWVFGGYGIDGNGDYGYLND